MVSETIHDLPAPQKFLEHLLPLARLPEAPMIALHWFDAAFAADERWHGSEPSQDYKAGCPDVVVGLYLGIVDGCVIMSHSAYVRENRPTAYRHIWNIPVSLVVKVEVLQVKVR